MDSIQCLIVGAGVAGLAIARKLATEGYEVLVVEAEDGIGTQTSSRNSEVIHAGIYYPTNSLMARLCVRGRAALYAFCREHGVPYRRCGKLIVATNDDEKTSLATMAKRAADNGVDDLRLLDASAVRNLEPALTCAAALLSPSTGILDSHLYMLALQGDAEASGASFAFHAPLRKAAAAQGRFVVDIGGRDPMTIGCNILINAAGLQAPAIARSIEGVPSRAVPNTYFAKGNYFSCSARVPFSRLIYPVPVPGGLGVHLTLDMAGQARFGPDVEWIDHIDYSVDPARAETFYPAIRRYWRDLPDGSLQPAYSGIRPKIVPPNVAAQDFIVQGMSTHGIRGLINLFGIESPGLTASLAIADHVFEMLGGA